MNQITMLFHLNPQETKYPMLLMNGISGGIN